MGGAAVKDGKRAVDTDFEVATTLAGRVFRVSAGDPHYKLNIECKDLVRDRKQE